MVPASHTANRSRPWVGSHHHVAWSNSDVIGRATTSDIQGIWDSRTLAPGQTFTFIFTTAGTYTYHCTIHGTLMIGTVVVQ
jgi:plastocyanin